MIGRSWADVGIGVDWSFSGELTTVCASTEAGCVRERTARSVFEELEVDSLPSIAGPRRTLRPVPPVAETAVPAIVLDPEGATGGSGSHSLGVGGFVARG